MKFSNKAIKRAQEDLNLDITELSNIQQSDKVEEVMRIGFECAGLLPDKANEAVENATRADLVAAWTRDMGLDILKKFESRSSSNSEKSPE